MLIQDNYTYEILKERYIYYRQSYQFETELKNKGIKIRHQNPPEDLTENIVKFIVRRFDNDPECVWCKSLGLPGDLYSPKYDNLRQIEIKSFTSNGPMQFGPNKKFGVLYFLDIRGIAENRIILWKAGLTDESPAFQNIKVNKTQTLQEQQNSQRRPHISWDKVYEQIREHCEIIFEGTFEDIFDSTEQTKK